MKKVVNSATLNLWLYNTFMKFLGIDYGTKRIGLATADSQNKIATPLKVIDNNGDALKTVVEICKKKKIDTIVIGESKDRSGRENPVMEYAKEFANGLINSLETNIVFADEFGSSVAASQQPGSPTHVDGSAAAVILNRYLNQRDEKNDENSNS